MLIFDFHKIGGKLFDVRKRLGLTQMEVAEAAGLSDRTYADIERGTVNMRVETVLRICKALHISPDEVLTEDNPLLAQRQEEIMNRLLGVTHTALRSIQCREGTYKETSKRKEMIE